jgi:hypothetical protein
MTILHAMRDSEGRLYAAARSQRLGWPRRTMYGGVQPQGELLRTLD